MSEKTPSEALERVRERLGLRGEFYCDRQRERWRGPITIGSPESLRDRLLSDQRSDASEA
jgi:hypothetical protein